MKPLMCLLSYVLRSLAPFADRLAVLTELPLLLLPSADAMLTFVLLSSLQGK